MRMRKTTCLQWLKKHTNMKRKYKRNFSLKKIWMTANKCVIKNKRMILRRMSSENLKSYIQKGESCLRISDFRFNFALQIYNFIEWKIENPKKIYLIKEQSLTRYSFPSMIKCWFLTSSMRIIRIDKKSISLNHSWM